MNWRPIEDKKSKGDVQNAESTHFYSEARGRRRPRRASGRHGYPQAVRTASARATTPWKQGQPASIADSKLAPIAPPPLPTPADKLPLNKLKTKTGFEIDVYAAGVPNARSLRLGDKGTVFVSSRLQDKVHAIVTKNGRREVKVIASGLHRPNGIALHKGTLYIAELSQISKIEKIEDNLDNPPKPTVILADLPKDEPHSWNANASRSCVHGCEAGRR